MSTVKLNTDCICLGHLATNARSLQETANHSARTIMSWVTLHDEIHVGLCDCEMGLRDNVSDLENRARAKPSYYFYRQETFLCLHFFLSPQKQRTPLENSTTKVACYPGKSALRVTEIAKSDQTEDV